MRLQNTFGVHFSMYQAPISKDNLKLGYYDNGFCVGCGRKGVKTAKLPFNNATWVCQDCWERLIAFYESPYPEVSKYEYNRNPSTEDVKWMCNFMIKKEEFLRIKKQRFIAYMAALHLAWDMEND